MFYMIVINVVDAYKTAIKLERHFITFLNQQNWEHNCPKAGTFDYYPQFLAFFEQLPPYPQSHLTCIYTMMYRSCLFSYLQLYSRSYMYCTCHFLSQV